MFATRVGFWASTGPQSSAVIMIGNTTVLNAYAWTNSGGFGTKYTNGTFSNAGQSCAYSPDGNYIAVASTGTPFIHAWPFNTSTGIGTKYGNPGTLPPNAGRGCRFSASGNTVFVVHSNSPFISAYKWSSSGFGTKFANPATLPSGTNSFRGDCMTNSANDWLVTTNGTTSGGLYQIGWNDTTGFGTRVTNAAPQGASSICIDIAPDDTAITYTVSNFTRVYAWSNSTGIGTQFVSPSFSPDTEHRASRFSHGSNVIAYTAAPAGPIAYQWSGSWGTRYANPPSSINGVANDLDWSIDDAAVITNAGVLTAWSFDYTTGWVARYSNPSPSPTFNTIPNGCKFNL